MPCLCRYASRIRELYPNCPAGVEQKIAEHACLKYSGRVGRSAEAKAMDENKVLLAVQAYIRHSATRYDELLLEGCERWEARELVKEKISGVMGEWGGGMTAPGGNR